MPYKDLKKIFDKKTPLLKSNCKLVTYSGHTMEPNGKAMFKCYHMDKEYQLEFQVAEGKSPAIIGRDACTKRGLIKRVFKVENEDDILREY